MQRIKNHPLVASLLSLEGNPRVLVFLEPLWGIPYNLIAPFATLYMYAQGVNDAQIGLILSISTIIKVFFAFGGGIITDKLGRKTTTNMGDLLGWTVACVIWAISDNFWWFLAATLMNSFEHVNQTAWQCLLVEDAQEKDVVNMYTWINIAGLLAVFFAPISGLLIERYSLVPVVRTLYGIFAFTMLIKAYITFRYTSETTQGKIRKAQTKNTPVMQMVREYKRVFPLMFKDSNMVRIFIITVLLSISGMVTGTFFGLYANLNLGVSQSLLAIFPIFRAAVMLVFFFGLAKILDRFKVKKPLIVGLVLSTISLILLALSPKGMLWPLILYTLLDAVANCLIMPRKDSMLMTGIDKQERARILALVVGCSFICTTPFGYLAGLLSQWDRRLPFVFAALLYVLCIVTMARYKDEPNEEI